MALMTVKFCVVYISIILIWSKISGGFTYPPKAITVHTKYGDVIGSLQISRNSQEFTAFKGIPYAKPPVGELRFKAPEPPDCWSFPPNNGTEDAPFCIQKNYFFANPKVEGNEDCLYLNVYVPNITSSQLLPVMVFIHWGGFFAGRGSSDIVGPEYFMDKHVILVTFNYRLGVFGFFTTLDDNAPGNFGLKDQVLALKFVQENIERFGGDKHRVTIFGQSAGGGSVSLHLISPLSKGLFQQAISQSGTSLNLWAKPGNAIQPNVIKALALFAGCGNSSDNNFNLVQCLREISAHDLAKTADNFKYFSVEPLTPYTIVTETKTQANPNPFLTKEPLEYLEAGEFEKVPWIVGNVQDEGILRVAPLLRQPETREILNAKFSNLIPQVLGLQLSTNTSDLFTNMINFYLDGNTSVDVNNSKSIQGFIDMYSDRSFTYGTYQTVFLQAMKGHSPIWMYNFNYKGQYSYGDKFAATENNINFNWGVSHCDDLLYLFKTPALFPDLQEKTDLKVSNDMVALWTNFAIYGNPDPYQTIKWVNISNNTINDIKKENLVFLNITGNYALDNVEFKIQKGFYTKRMDFWVKQKINENFPGLQ